MDYRLGIDLGTNSIGAVALALDVDGRPQHIAWHRAHIFSEPLENNKGNLVPKAQDRRLARQQRRQLQRRQRRVKKIAHLAPLLGLQCDAIKNDRVFDRKTIKIDGFNIPYLIAIRAKAASEQVTLEDLLRIFLHMVKKRGYYGGFKVKADKDKGKVQTGSEKLNNELGERTLGQYFVTRLQQGLPIRLKIQQIYRDSPDLFALRDHVQHEFEIIWQTQSQYHAVLNQQGLCPFTQQHKSIKDIFHHALFYQRPLKPFADKVGQCLLEPTLPRAPKAHMAAQAFRIEQILGNLRVGQGRRAIALTPEQKTVIRELLNKQAEVKFEKIYTALEKADCALPAGKKFSVDRAKKDSLKGNTTLAGFKALKLLDDWQALDDKYQTQVINLWSELGSPEQLDDKNWHNNFLTQKTKRPRQFEKDTVVFMNQLIDSGKFDRLSKMKHFEGGRSAYSIKAMRQLTDCMRTHNCDEADAIEKCYSRSQHTKPVAQLEYDSLPSPAAVGNAVVDVAMKQIQHVVNDCIDSLGGVPKQIIVETSRDIKNSVSKRNELESRNKKQAAYKKRIAAEIEKNQGIPTPSNLLKYELWEQQDTKCPYCSNPIGSDEVLNGAATNFEHVIPRSKSKVGYKRSEIMLAHRGCNAKKKDLLPLLAFADDKQRISAIHAMAAIMEKKKQYRKAQLLRLDDQEGLLDDDSVSGFNDWQHHDTSWIAKLTLQYLKQLKACDVSVTRGGITAQVRKTFGLETVIPEARYVEGKTVLTEDKKSLSIEEFKLYKSFYEGHRWQHAQQAFPPRLDKRIDHRHHLIDALIIALCDRSVVQRVTREHQQQYEQAKRKREKFNKQALIKNIRGRLGRALQYFKVREQACEMIACAHITHRPDHNLGGRFYQDTAYHRIIDQESDKFRLIVRKTLSELSVKNDKDKTLKNLQTIVSVKVREHVINIFERRINSGLTPEEALAKPIEQNWYHHKKPIFRVKVYFDRSAEKADRVIFSGQRQLGCKYLIPDLFAYMTLQFNEKGQLDISNSGLTTLADATRCIGNSTPGNTWRFYKGDTVVDQESGVRFLIHKFKAVGGGTVFMAPLTESRNYDQLKSNDGAFSVGISKLHRYKPEHVL